jgi:hypothetical protein
MHFNREKLDDFNYYYLLILIVFISFMLRIYFRSNYLDDWDSVQFILGLNDYSIVNHQPHPPGYPVYIFLGRIFNYFLKNDLLSFTTMSALFGSLALIPTYLLGRDLFGSRVGILSALILSLVPAEMLFSEVVMSDIVSMFFIVTTVCLLYRGIDSTSYLYIGSLMLGVTMGVRQTDLLLLPLFIFITIRKNNLKNLIISWIIFFMGVAIWLVPVIVDTGLSTFIYMMTIQGKSAADAGTLNSLGGLNLYNLIITVKTLALLLVSAWSPAIIFFSLLAVGLIVYQMKKFKELSNLKQLLILLGWIVPYFALFIFVTSLYISRYLLPIFPSLAIIFSYSLTRIIEIIRPKPLKVIMILIIFMAVAFMGFHAISNSYLIHTTEPAPVIAAEFIKEHYAPNNTIILSSDSFRHFQYYLPNFVVISLLSVSPKELYSFIIENKTIISENIPIIINNYRAYVFNRDGRIYSKQEKVILYENKISPDSNTIFLDKRGWYGIENWGGASTRWIERYAILCIYSANNNTALLHFDALSFYRNRTLEIITDNDMGVRQAIPMNLSSVTVPIRLTKGANTVQINVLEGCERPSDFKELGNTDSRCISVAIQNISLTDNGSVKLEYSEGFYGPEDWSGTLSRWMQGDAFLWANSPEGGIANLSMQALSFYRNRTLVISSSDVPIWRGAVPTYFAKVNVPLQLAKGANIVRLHVAEGCERPCDIIELNNSDTRCLSVAVQNLTVE